MRDDFDWMLLGRFLRGDCSPAEAEAVGRWKAADAANARLLAFMQAVWDECAIELPEIDQAQAWRKLQTAIAVASKPAVVRPLRVLPGAAATPRRRWWRGLAIGTAAAAVVAIAVGGAIVQSRGRGNAQAATLGRECATTRGQRAEFILSDGTQVWLNSASRLRVPPGYGVDSRDVALEGEAYFRVRRDDARPFRVHTPGAVAEDLGTEFNVRAYPDDGELRVVVASGRVALHRTDSSAGTGAASGDPARLDLTRGQMGRLDRTGRLALVGNVDLRPLLSWRDGELAFVRRPTAEVLRELERWYDIEIALDDPSLASVPITATLGPTTVDHALAVVAGVLQARFTRHGRQARITTSPPP